MRTRLHLASSANNWWERSPYSGNSTNFCNVNNSGAANNNNASNNNGLAPSGCVPKAQGSSHGETGRASAIGCDGAEMQGGAAVAARPKERRRSRGGSRPRDTAYAGAAC